MSEFVIKKYHSILSVGDEWDDLVKDNIYLTKKFVAFMEKVDQCKQEYYMIYNNEKLDGVFMMYHRAKYNLTMFTKFINDEHKDDDVLAIFTRPVSLITIQKH